MELTINDKIISFKFGVKFVREIDKNFPIEQEGIKFGMGLSAKIYPELMTANVATLADILFLANRTEKPKLTLSEIEDYIDECDDIEGLFDEVTNQITESNTGKLLKLKMQEAQANG